MSVASIPLSRAARFNTASVGSAVLMHRNAEPFEVKNKIWNALILPTTKMAHLEQTCGFLLPLK